MKFSKHVLFTRSIYVKYLAKPRCILFSLLVLRGLASKHFHVCRASGMSIPFIQTVKIDILNPEKGTMAYIRQLILLYRSH